MERIKTQALNSVLSIAVCFFLLSKAPWCCSPLGFNTHIKIILDWLWWSPSLACDCWRHGRVIHNSSQWEKGQSAEELLGKSALPASLLLHTTVRVWHLALLQSSVTLRKKERWKASGSLMMLLNQRKNQAGGRHSLDLLLWEILSSLLFQHTEFQFSATSRPDWYRLHSRALVTTDTRAKHYGRYIPVIGESPGPYPHCAYSKIRHSIAIQSLFDWVVLLLLTGYGDIFPKDISLLFIKSHWGSA